jgi:hypothetical protein
VTGRAIDYLRSVPESYLDRLGGIRWAPSGDAVVFADGATFALAPEIGLFVLGFAGRARLVHFAYVLHALAWLGRGRLELAPPFDGLRRAFVDTGRYYRNAGALFAHLCERLPRTAATVDADEVARVLVRSVSAAAEIVFADGRLDYDEGAEREPPAGEHLRALLQALESVARQRELPPLLYESFEIHIRDELSRIDVPLLELWLRHGEHVRKEAGEAIAREALVEKPTLADVLARVSERPRLGGAASLLTQLASALVIPPRRLATSELPLGGYSDVATRGHPEQILPSQLALEPIEFVRRFAENELLYYRREEPHARVREELVVLVDQGARTWGPVRIVLGAAALALGKLAARKNVACLFASSGNSGTLVDPVAAEAELVKLLEASDLTLAPAEALERVLEQPTEDARDVVLLTHPRSLATEAVLAAARRAQKPVRLFAVAADDSGAVELSELRHGAPVSLSRFKVEIAPPAEGKSAASSVSDPRAWKGDIESVPWPFVFGPTGQLAARSFDFDPTGEWILIAARKGLLFAHRVDGTRSEIWPRGAVLGSPLQDVQAVLGVNGGFVVAGRVERDFAVAHYDLADRKVRVHAFGPESPPGATWLYFPDLHAVGCVFEVQEGDALFAIDLATGHSAGRAPGKQPIGFASPRATTAVERLAKLPPGSLPPPELEVTSRLESPGELDKRALVSVDKDGAVELRGWFDFVPLADGRPILAGVKPLAGKRRGDVLALATHEHPKDEKRLHHTARNMLRLFRKDGVVLGEHEQASDRSEFQLSHDGWTLARDLGKARVEVRRVGGGAPSLVTTPGRFHNELQLLLGDRWLAIEVQARQVHIVRWDGERLLTYPIAYRAGNPTTLETIVRRELQGVAVREAGMRATRWRVPEIVRNDPGRWVIAAEAELTAVVDRYGQIALFDREKKLVAMFFAWRKDVAAWLPDGTIFGPPKITGSPVSPDASRKIALALQAATARGKAVTT